MNCIASIQVRRLVNKRASNAGLVFWNLLMIWVQDVLEFDWKGNVVVCLLLAFEFCTESLFDCDCIHVQCAKSQVNHRQVFL